MTKRKRPIGDEWKSLVNQWYRSSHQEKLELALTFGVTYDTMKHWISESIKNITASGIPRTITVEKLREVTTEELLGIVSDPPLPIRMERSNSPVAIETEKGITTAIILGDTHIPYQDVEVLAAVENLMGCLKPNLIIYNGDINDFYQVSVFAKDPSRLGQLQEDIDLTTNLFQRHADIVPAAARIFIEGTHENRWFKYLQEKAPALSKLRGTNIQTLYKLGQYGIDYVPFERGLLVNKTFLVLHGDIASNHSAYTAKQHSDKSGGSGICNHTHRGGSYFKRDRFQTTGWWENFCLCQLNPDWIQNPNWQQGFSVVHFEDTGRFWVEQVPIIEGRFIYGGTIYGGKK